MAKPDIDKISLRMENIWRAAGLRIMQDIVRRIKKTGKITSTADYQINRLLELGQSTEEIERTLKEALNATYPEMFELYDEVANWQYVRNRDVYEQVNGKFIPPEENEWLQKMSEAVKSQTKDELVNLAQSYGFSVMIGSRRVFTPFSMYYHQYVDSAIMDIISGAFDYNTVIRRTVKQMTDSGLRTVDYATGRSSRVDVAVRRAVMTGVSQITEKINERTAKELGTDYFEVDWHYAARPDHRVWQGKVYSREELETICGLHTVTGLHGANCKHDYYAFVPGASKRMYPDEWLEEQNRKEAITKEWKGKKYDAYERTQKQRQMETAMRAQREKVQLLKDSGASKDEVMLARCKYQAQLNEYSRYCKKMDLPEQRERIYYDMRGRVAPYKKHSMRVADTSDKWAKAAKNELLMDERSLSRRKKENAVIYDSNGRYLFAKRGNEKEVVFTGSEVKRMKNCIVTHNHPSGGSFSIPDWKLFKKAKLQEIRAISGDEIYYLRRKGNSEINVSDEEFENKLKAIRKKVRNRYQKLYKDGIINEKERFLFSSDEYNRKWAEAFGLEYGKEKLNG